MPKVSIILSSYNQAKYLAESIESVLNQTYKDYELLIFDDGSKDNSPEIIKSFSDDRIKLFLYEKNLGATKAFRKTLENAVGEYVALQHSDDVWEETKLEKQVKFLDENPEYEVCFSAAKFIDETGEIYNLPENHPYKTVFKQKNRSREEWLNHLFWKMSSFCNPSMLIRNARENFVENSCLYQLPDYFFWLTLCKRKNIYVFEEELVKFRLRREIQDSVSSFSLEKSVRNANESYFTVREFLPLTNDKEEFLKIFPEAKKYLVDEKIDTKFAFAKLCLDHSLQSYNKLGLELIYELLQNQKKADLIKKLYNYDVNNFISDTGKYDIYGIKFQIPILNMKFYFDFGDDFDEKNSVEKIVLIKSDNTFSLNFEYPVEKNVKRIRFDPDDKPLLKIKFEKFLINGEEIKDYGNNAIKNSEDFIQFCTSDPFFVIDKEFFQPKLQIQILGKIDLNAAIEVNQLIHDMNGEIVGLKNIIAGSQEEIGNLKKIIAALQENIRNLKNSTSWKITKPLRDIGDFIKKRK